VPGRCFILVGPLRPTIQGAPRAPLAFTIQDIANRLRRGNNSVPGYEGGSQAVRGNPADRIIEGGKRFRCVTTRRCKFRLLNILLHGLGLLTARFLCLGVQGFDPGILPAFGLPPRRLPAVYLP
jgi:hypothetical protein